MGAGGAGVVRRRLLKSSSLPTGSIGVVRPAVTDRCYQGNSSGNMSATAAARSTRTTAATRALAMNCSPDVIGWLGSFVATSHSERLASCCLHTSEHRRTSIQ
jgi:hypothetical protein